MKTEKRLELPFVIMYTESGQETQRAIVTWEKACRQHPMEAERLIQQMRHVITRNV